MNNKNKWIYTCIIVASSAFLLSARVQETPEQTEPVKVPEDSFIRMDLISAEKEPMPPPKRNIFTVGSTRAAEEISPEILEARMEEIRNSQNPQAQGEEILSSLNLRYLGYVLSGSKIVGLIVFEGEALAVVEGDLITEDYTVGRINSEEIEVIGPDSKTEMFAIEGEFP